MFGFLLWAQIFFLKFSSQRLIISELRFLSIPMFFRHRSLLVLLQFCIILISTAWWPICFQKALSLHSCTYIVQHKEHWQRTPKVADAFIRQPLPVEFRVRSQANLRLGFVVNRVALGRSFLHLLRFSLVVIAAMLRMHSFITDAVTS